MKPKDFKIPPEWLNPSSLEEALQVQNLLASRVQKEDDLEPIVDIGGLDVSNNLKEPDEIYASAVLLERKNLRVTSKSTADQHQLFPYIPGFLGFREAPCLIEAIRRLDHMPQLFMVDGHGISHPRGLGIASHIGVLLDVPTIGVAKSILVGQLADPLGPAVGDRVALIWKGKQIATVLRTKERCNPLIISIGHKISLETAVKLVLDCSKGYRLPEPTRQAHLAANECRRQGMH